MNGPDWLEITILLQGNFTAVFSFGGTAPESPHQGGGLPKVTAALPGPPLQWIFYGRRCCPITNWSPMQRYLWIQKIIRLHTQQRENWCSYLRVFLLSNIRVQSGCQNWPTQQRLSLAAIPHNLREISSLKPWKILSTAPQHKTALQPQHLPNLDYVSPSLSHAGPASAFPGLR